MGPRDYRSRLPDSNTFTVTRRSLYLSILNMCCSCIIVSYGTVISIIMHSCFAIEYTTILHSCYSVAQWHRLYMNVVYQVGMQLHCYTMSQWHRWYLHAVYQCYIVTLYHNDAFDTSMRLSRWSILQYFTVTQFMYAVIKVEPVTLLHYVTVA